MIYQVRFCFCATFMRNFNVHPTAIVDESAIIEAGCIVGPYSIIGPGVVLHENVHLVSHVIVEENTTIGANSRVHPFSVLGGDPQHLSYGGQSTYLVIGKNAEIREHVTMHRGTLEGGGKTIIGDRVLAMVGVHVAHDCCIGNDVVMANQATLGGHVVVGDHAVLGGLCAIHQFTRIGEGAMVAGCSGVNTDIAPYSMVLGHRAFLRGINRVKLTRLGATHAEIKGIHRAFQWIFHNRTDSFAHRVKTLPQELLNFERVQAIQAFLSDDAKRPICMVDEKYKS
jgi:UDP-N-acetylglucosamine acyltransferase